VLWLIAFAAPVLMPSHASLINEIAIVALFAVSLDLVLGYTGIVSLGHAAFFGIGGYAAALFAKLVMPDPLVGLAVGIATATLLGAVCSLTILRGSDLTRLMVTLGVALILLELANKLDWLTGGADGLQGVVMGPLLGRFEFDLVGPHGRLLFAGGAAGVVCADAPAGALAAGRDAQGDTRQPPARHGHRHSGRVAAGHGLHGGGRRGGCGRRADDADHGLRLAGFV
jgi:ABC-type branched-subunit amino acid transport system permease subunit